MNNWSMKTKVAVTTNIVERFEHFANETVLFVFDPFLKSNQKVLEMIAYLEQKNRVITFTEIVPDPPIEKVVKGMQIAMQAEPTVVIAIGGGSALDTAKGIIYFYQKVAKQAISYFVAIPTTSGTGSEVTSAAVITDTANKIKYPIFDEQLVPDEAILSIDFVLTSPPSITAYSGLDVLTHALEALVAKGRTNYSSALAEKAIGLVFSNLVECVKNGQNEEARVQMHEAATLAGVAFDNAGLGVCHALAHQVGALFKVPHGLANAMLLPHVILANAKDWTAKALYADVSRKLKLCTNGLSDEVAVIKLVDAIKRLSKESGVPTTLAEWKVEESSAHRVADQVAANAANDFTFQSNPIAFNHTQLKEIYQKIV
ncbi:MULTISPECIES: 1-propanol dehydrogenase PduQ [unclassified Enterococcus]|uniref:1-propanol dehydrogenase PduQ n=1 Tax=unclassified Enterococcus TaxID=2608891 RepID=UPI001F6107E3|nr:1-propanol dehydrogenase PduQ [Enterococcus sp. DIV1271a]